VIQGYTDLTPEALAPLGFDDPAQACRLLQNMAGHHVPDSLFDGALRVLLPALADCADPDRAVSNLARWADAAPSRLAAYTLLASHPPAAQILVSIMAASQLFADLLIQTPETLEALTNTRGRNAVRSPDTLYADMARRVLLPTLPNARRDALRRVKGPEVLRIGVRDLLGEATFEQTVADISAFADACVRLAWEICRAERPDSPREFAVLALGKLGGQELNYSSDIDLVFVHGDDADAGLAVKMGECVRDTLAKPTGSGFVFRVDLRLRPEGRFGPISRSLGACRAYYESWAEPWERQALMKARFVAGDPALGAAFLAMTQDFVYPPHVDDQFVQSIRQNKRRLERKIADAGEAGWNVKEGVGGIRDIEFAVQLMTLVSGGMHPALRSGNTLDTLVRLTQAGLLTPDEQHALRDSYLFLRTVEHRLQLLDEQAVRALPREAGARRKLARRMGCANLEDFDRDYQRHTQQAHALFTRLFYGASEPGTTRDTEQGDIAAWALAPNNSAAQANLAQALSAHGVVDTPAALRLIARAVQGSEYGGVQSEARDAFARLLGPLLEAAGRTRSPDAVLRGFDALADAMPSRAGWYALLGTSPRLLPRLASLAGDAPVLWQTLLAHGEFLDMLADEPLMDTRRLFAPSSAPAPSQMATDALRARLHVGARDIWHLAPTEETLAQTTRIAEVLAQSALALALSETEFGGSIAVIGLGKAGGEEMAYQSDMDVLYVAGPEHLREAARVAERMQQIGRSELLRHGVSLEMDARLRPHGRDGALVLDLASYEKYYAQCPTWERQMLLKSRPVAGDAALGQAFVALAHHAAYAVPADEATTSDIRAMKQRWERERLQNPLDLKLGPGGMADIEWTVQLLQMQHGAKNRRIRLPGTLPALRALRDDALLTQADWEALSQTYTALAELRNQGFLQTGVSADIPLVLPDTLMQSRQRARALCLRLFYGIPADKQ